MADFSNTKVGDVTMLVVRGKLDTSNLEDLKAEMMAIERSRVKKVIVDVQGLRQIDSSGVGLLMWLTRRVGRSGGQVRLAGLTGQPRAVFEALRFDRILELCSTVEDAIRKLSSAV